jgi:hypothetical protein
MRMIIALGLLIALAGCSGNPAEYGITGPGVTPLPPVAKASETPDTSPTPGVVTTGTSFGPSNGSVKGASGFWGFN